MRGLALALLVVALATFAASAQEAVFQPSRSARIDNDYFVFSRPPRERADNDYSHGIAVAAASEIGRNRATRIVCGSQSRCGLALEIGQEMYSPDIGGPEPIDGQRPNAGWLYGRAELRSVRAQQAIGVGVVVGGTGPNARADDLQDWFHELYGFREPEGWEHQLSNEIAFAATIDAKRLGFIGTRERWGADVVPRVSLSVGTLRVSAGSDVAVRFGWGLRHPWVNEPASRVGLYIRAGVGGELVSRSLFLDGNTFRSSVHVPVRSPIREWERGFGMRMLKLLVEYSVTSRSAEYPDAPSVHSFGRIAVTWLH